MINITIDLKVENSGKNGLNVVNLEKNDATPYLTDIHIEKNKRNYRKQRVHLMGARAIQEINNKVNDIEWRNKEGRPKGSGTKQETVKKYQEANPDARKIDYIRDTGLSKMTVYKWWNS